MSGGGGKGGSSSGSSTQTVKVELDEDLKAASLEALAGGFRTASLPYANFDAPAVASFTPEEMAAFEGAGQAAEAFGLPRGPADSQYLPEPDTVGGFSGYSPGAIYDEAVNNLPAGYEAMQQAILSNYGGAAQRTIFSESFGEALGEAYPGYDVDADRPAPSEDGEVGDAAYNRAYLQALRHAQNGVRPMPTAGGIFAGGVLGKTPEGSDVQLTDADRSYLMKVWKNNRQGP